MEKDLSEERWKQKLKELTARFEREMATHRTS